MEEAAEYFGTSTASRANSLSQFMTNCVTMLGLLSSLPIVKSLEQFNCTLQGKKVTVAGKIEAFEMRKNEIASLKQSEKFTGIFEQTEGRVKPTATFLNINASETQNS